MLAKGWLSDRLGLYLISAGLLHAAAAYTATLETLGWHPVGGDRDPGGGRAERLLRRCRRYPPRGASAIDRGARAPSRPCPGPRVPAMPRLTTPSQSPLTL